MIADRIIGVVLVAGAVFALACTKESEPTTARLAIEVTPLTLEGIDEAIYTLRVWNDDSPRALVWEQTGLRSTRFGDGGGALSYVGPCDATSNPNHVELELESLWADGEELADDEYVNPAPPGDPLTLDVECLENRDVLVPMNLAIVRDAEQGFLDLAVNFDEIFCSAKLDCEYANGEPIELLHVPGSGVRGPAVVLAFACTSGPGGPTYLSVDSVEIFCPAVPVPPADYTLSPGGDRGNQGAMPDLIFQHAIYRGSELLLDSETGEDLDKCYWNMAIGISLGELAAEGPCLLRTRATATPAPLALGYTPADTIWPVITWDAVISSDGTTLACDQDGDGQNPLDGEGSHVTTSYSDFDGAFFPRTMDCATGAVSNVGQVACAGGSPAIQGDGLVSFTSASDGWHVRAGTAGAGPYQLPAGLAPGAGIAACCVDPCCDAPQVP